MAFLCVLAPPGIVTSLVSVASLMSVRTLWFGSCAMAMAYRQAMDRVPSLFRGPHIHQEGATQCLDHQGDMKLKQTQVVQEVQNAMSISRINMDKSINRRRTDQLDLQGGHLCFVAPPQQLAM